MKRYVKAAKQLTQEQLDQFVDQCVEAFADLGFEMEIGRVDNRAYNLTVALSVISVDGDSTIVYDGNPVYGGYAMNMQPWFNPSYHSEFDERVQQSIQNYANRWLETYEELQGITDEIAEIEPELPAIRDEFLRKYSSQFPGLSVDVSIDVWMTENVNGKFKYPLLYGGRRNNPSLRFDIIADGEELREIYLYSSWVSGEAEEDLVKQLAKIYKRKGRGANSGNSEIVAILKEHGIDTTKSKYELVAETYERYESGRKYKKNFSCPGDYLAYFAMCLHATPNYNNLMSYFGDVYEFEDFVDANPTVNDIEDHAASSWWGDGDDYIISLTNINTGEVLYESEDTPEEYDEDGWED